MIKILLLILNITAQSNPFSIITKLDSVDYSGEEYYELLITVRSISKNQGKYLFKVDLSKDIDLIEGNKNYRDELKGLGEKKYSIVVNPLAVSEGEIVLTVYSYKNDWAIDTNNKRIFISKFKITKNDKDKLILSIDDVIESEKVYKAQELKAEELSADPSNKATFSDEVLEKNNTQKFFFVRKSKTLNIFRYIMLLISIGIVGYFIYRLRKK